MPTTLEAPAKPGSYAAIPLSGLAASEPLAFPLYLRTADQVWVLYRPATSDLDASHLGRLQAEGVAELFIRECDRALYYERVTDSLDKLLKARDVPVERRAEVLHGVAVKMAEELLATPPDRVGIQKAQKVMMATSGLLLRESQGFAAIRRTLSVSTSLSRHALTVSFLSMGLAREVLGADANGIMVAGLAGLLHDVGRIDPDGIGVESDEDQGHTVRGAEYLHSLGLPEPVVQAARSHHERWDGTGFPQGLARDAIPKFTHNVDLVDTVDKVYNTQNPKVGVFDALRILAMAYRDCFDGAIAAGLVKLFR
ncbi:MAG: HDIG domain-containing protein [Planctomycetes bacterium]|nr:HDIG domain-containing protein [Planctomycetota bacterium]